MPTLGQLLASIRKSSHFRDEKTFCTQAQLSLEQYRAFEADKVIPTRKVLKRILDAGGVSEEVEYKAIRERDLVKAKSVGISTQLIPNEKEEEAVTRLTKMFERFLVRIDVDITPMEKRQLRDMITTTLKEVING